MIKFIFFNKKKNSLITNHKDIGILYPCFLLRLKNNKNEILFLKILTLIIMKISIYLIKISDYTFTLNIHEDMVGAAIWVVISTVGAASSMLVMYYIWNVELEEAGEELVKRRKEYNKILIKDEEIKPSAFLKLQNEAGDFSVNSYVYNRAIVLTLCTALLIISIGYGIISLDEYKDFVRTYRIANGIWNDGKIPNIKEWREDGNQ